MLRSIRPTIVLASLSIFVLPAILLYPVNFDNDTFQSMAVELTRSGGLPYLGSWNTAFPATVWIYAAAITCFGNSCLGLRLMELLWQVVTVILVYHVSRLWLSERTSLVASALYTFMYVFGPTTLMGQPDGFAVLPILAATGLSVVAKRSDHPNLWRMLTAGYLYGFAGCIRPTYGLLLAAPFLSLFPLRERQGRHEFLLAVAGAAAILFLFIFPYLLKPGALHEVYLALVQFNLEVYSAIPAERLSGRVWIAIGIAIGWCTLILLHKLGGKRFRESPKEDKERRFLTLTMAGLILGVVVQRKFFSYHLIPLFAFAIPGVSAIGLEWLGKIISRPVAAIGVAITCWIGSVPWGGLRPFLSSGFSFDQSYYALEPDRWYGVRDQERITSYINHTTNDTDRVEYVSMYPGPRWRIARNEVTRFTSIWPLIVHNRYGSLSDFQQRWCDEFVTGLERTRPKIIAIQDIPDPSHTTSERFPPVLVRMHAMQGFDNLMDSKYRYETTIANCQIYRRIERHAQH